MLSRCLVSILKLLCIMCSKQRKGVVQELRRLLKALQKLKVVVGKAEVAKYLLSKCCPTCWLANVSLHLVGFAAQGGPDLMFSGVRR